jgi:hypothetical protein
LVKTPAQSTSEGELQNVTGFENYYTKTVVDSKLSGKSDTGHNHTKSNISDFPTAIKNPEPLTINGQNYDGSSAISFDIATIDNLNQKSDYNHTHDGKNDIFIEFTNGTFPLNNCIFDLYSTKLNNITFDEFRIEYISKIQELENRITSEFSRLENLITSEISRLESIINNT